MWWGVVCVLVLHFCEELAQLNEDSEYDNIADFVDYDEESETIQPDVLHLRARRKGDTSGVLTPMSLDSNEIEDSTFKPSRSTKLEKKISIDVDTISTSEVTAAVLKSEFDDYLAKEKEELQSMDAREDKDIDVKNNLIRFIEENKGKIVDLAKQNAAKQETTSNTELASITSLATAEYETTNSEANLEIENNNFLTPLTWSALDDLSTVKDASEIDTNFDSYSIIAIEENTKDTPKVITKEVDTENTVIDSSVFLSDEYLVNKDVSSSGFATQKEESASETPSSLTSVTYVTESTTEAIATENLGIERPFVFPQRTVGKFKSATKSSDWESIERQGNQKKTTTLPRPTLNYSDTNIDIPKLLQILDLVVFDSADRFNLTRKFNETLQNYTIPTCEPVPPTPEPTTEPPSTINFDDSQVVAKCFVCGLDVERVPYSTACADAFSGDFIPLVPIDPKARGQIANFRKYCRFLDVNRVITKEDEPHSVFGRFTGGCSVRWVDLTSIYTQRTCRNRRRAVMGKHFGSKRMAKLEMALNELDNGCIISPVATLLPVSRGISLYARFHACVCTGSWCNKAVVTRNCIINNVLMLFIITHAN